MNGSFEVEEIIGHFYDKNGQLRLWVKWAYYPLAAATSESAEKLKVSAKLAIRDYYQKLGLQDVTGDALTEKLKETETSDAPEQKPCKVMQITDHRIENGHLHFKTLFEEDSVIWRPKRAFAEEYEMEMVEHYMETHQLKITPLRATPKPRKIKETPVVTGTRSRPTATKLRQLSPEATPQSGDGDRPVRRRARSSTPELSDSDGEFIYKATKRRRVYHEPQVQRDKGQGRQKKAKILTIFKDDEDGELVLIKNKDGSLALEEMDSLFKKEPEMVYEAIKKAHFSK